MKVFRKVKKDNGRRHIYVLGIKFFSYPGKALRFYKRRLLESKNIDKKLRAYSGIGVVANSNRNPKIIVSLTSYPARIESIHTCIYSLLTQTLKPDKIILWLAKDNFPNEELDLPKKLLKLKSNGLTIKWTEDIKSYKKLVPALLEYPNDIIVTADDDLIYSNEWLEKLYESYLLYPKDIHVHRITRFEFNTKWITAGRKAYPNGSYLNKLTGGAGALYPPHSLYKDVTNQALFTLLAPTNDDQWFWFQAILNKVKIRVVKDHEQDLIYTENSQSVGLRHINDSGPNLFWKDFNRLAEYYPDAEQRMLQEFKERSKVGN